MSGVDAASAVVPVVVGGGLAAATMAARQPALTSPILRLMAGALRGGVRRRSERVVVWDFSSVAVVRAASRGFVVGAEDVFEEGEEVDVDGVEGWGAREDWKCERRVCVVWVRSMRARTSAAGVLGGGGMVG